MYIYKITNLINNKIYIGKWEGRNPIQRWNQHRYGLKRNSHRNSYLQNSWNVYGEENFTFEVVDQANSKDELSKLEIEWMVRLDTINREHGYNLVIGPSGFSGLKHSDETKAKMSSSQRGKPKSQEHKDKLSRVVTEKFKDKTKHPWYGKKIPDTTKINISLKKTKHNHTHVIDPNGNVHKIGPTLIEFCKIHGLQPTNMSKFLNGKSLKYKGWKLYE